MKVTFRVDIEVGNDWDHVAFAKPKERKDVVGQQLRQAFMLAAMQSVMQAMATNSVKVSGVTISEPEWEGWDNERIQREVAASESES